MNIVILGGGTPNRFGHDFALAARAQGHRVIIFSHKKNGLDDPDQHVINYNKLDPAGEIFANVLAEFSQIDIILLNQNGRNYPIGADNVARVELESYSHSFNLHVVASHLLISKAYQKLVDGSKVIYMTSGLAYQYPRDQFCLVEHFSYGGYKSMMTHLIIGFAKNRQKGIIFTVLSPHFPYEDVNRYKQVLAICYDWIFRHDDTANGTVTAAWRPDAPPRTMEIQVEFKD